MAGDSNAGTQGGVMSYKFFASKHALNIQTATISQSHTQAFIHMLKRSRSAPDAI